MILPLWLFVVLVVLAAWGLFVLAAPLRWRFVALAIVDALFLTIKLALERAAAEREFYPIFGSRPKKRKPRRPKGHARRARRHKK